jgi:HK97 family phage portal protein
MDWKNWLRPGRRKAALTAGETKHSVATGFVALHTQTDASWTRRNYAALAREGFMRNPVVHRSAKLVAEAAAAVPWLIYEDRRELSDHPLLRLLERPNAAQAGRAFMEALYGHLLLSGNAYVEYAGTEGAEGALYLVRPDRVTIVADEAGWPASIEIAEGASRRGLALEQAGPGAALHLGLFHPLDDHYGFPPLEAASMALDIHNSAARWNKALLDNSARPSGALVYAPRDGGHLTADQFDRLKGELEQGYSGAERAGRPLLLEGGLDWKAMGLTPRDMDFIEAKHAAAREIALAFGVPPMLLGIPGDNTYANYHEANRAFYRLTVLPLIGRIAAELTAWFQPRHGTRIRLWYDADRIDGLAPERDALWARVGAAPFLTEDEKREAVGYGPLGQGGGTDP